MLLAVPELKLSLQNDQRQTYRSFASKYNVSIPSSSHSMKHYARGNALLEASDRRSRTQRLRPHGEELIRHAILDFHNNGTPLNKACVFELATVLVFAFPPARRK